MKCNMDCFNCSFIDCINDEISVEEYKASDSLDNQANIILSNDYRIRWAQLHPERNRENKHRHYIENKESYNQRNKAYYDAHREEMRAKQRENYQKNIEYRRQWQREYVAKKKAERVS